MFVHLCFLGQDGHEICFVGDDAFRKLSKVDPKAEKLLEEVRDECLSNCLHSLPWCHVIVQAMAADKSNEWFAKKAKKTV